MTIRYKLHQQGNDTVLAAADTSALGQKHADAPRNDGRPRRVLDLLLFRSFYEGETVDEAGLARLLSECTSANLAGEKAVGVALASGLVQMEKVVLIGGVPHVQLYRILPE